MRDNRRAAVGPSGLHPELFEVELALERAQRRVVDLAGVAQRDDRAALRVDDAQLDLLVLEVLPAAARRSRRGPRSRGVARGPGAPTRAARAAARGPASASGRGGSSPGRRWYIVARASSTSSCSPSTPSQRTQRTTNGSVRPWPTSVARITAKVSSRIRLRSGKSSGSASAAASDTAPRSPDQPTRNVSRQASAGSRSAIRRRGESGSRLDRKTHDEAGHDGGRTDEDARCPGTRAGRSRSAPARMSGSARPEQHEHEAVEDERDHLPDRQPEDAAVGREHRPQPAPDHQPRGDDGEHAREVQLDARNLQLLGRQVGGVRDQQRDHDLDGRIVEPAHDLRHDPADDEADRDAADRRDEEVADRVGEHERRR